ncbi:MAG: hypothetical protein AAFQ52_17720, partial [Chloroflexota bacterium]
AVDTKLLLRGELATGQKTTSLKERNQLVRFFLKTKLFPQAFSLIDPNAHEGFLPHLQYIIDNTQDAELRSRAIGRTLDLERRAWQQSRRNSPTQFTEPQPAMVSSETTYVELTKDAEVQGQFTIFNIFSRTLNTILQRPIIYAFLVGTMLAVAYSAGVMGTASEIAQRRIAEVHILITFLIWSALVVRLSTLKMFNDLLRLLRSSDDKEEENPYTFGTTETEPQSSTQQLEELNFRQIIITRLATAVSLGAISYAMLFLLTRNETVLIVPTFDGEMLFQLTRQNIAIVSVFIGALGLILREVVVPFFIATVFLLIMVLV